MKSAVLLVYKTCGVTVNFLHAQFVHAIFFAVFTSSARRNYSCSFSLTPALSESFVWLKQILLQTSAIGDIQLYININANLSPATTEFEGIGNTNYLNILSALFFFSNSVVRNETQTGIIKETSFSFTTMQKRN